ncbi:MAG TPA: YihY/virulence factor BrkB family protein [Ilumatobacteraceae bacterium]
MSTANPVPETWELSGDDAVEALHEAKFGRLLVDCVKRFRSADGFSHARSLAFAVLLASVPGVIATIGLATVLGDGSFRTAVADALHGISPGPAGDILTTAINQGATTAAANGIVPLLFGLIAMTISGITAFGQIERGANRIYGVEQDRPFLAKYARAARLFVTSGTLIAAAFVIFGLGRNVMRSANLPGPDGLWEVARGAAGIVISVVSFALLFRLAPRRHQPNLSWLIVGSSIAALLWLIATAALAALWHLGATFGKTYGQLAGLMGFALWSYLIAIGLFIGIAFAAQLEAFRAGRSSPQDSTRADAAPAAEPARDQSSPAVSPGAELPGALLSPR